MIYWKKLSTRWRSHRTRRSRNKIAWTWYFRARMNLKIPQPLVHVNRSSITCIYFKNFRLIKISPLLYNIKGNIFGWKFSHFRWKYSPRFTGEVHLIKCLLDRFEYSKIIFYSSTHVWPSRFMIPQESRLTVYNFFLLSEREREREREATEIQADKIYKSSILHMGICGNETLQKSIKRLSLINPFFNIFELIIWYHIWTHCIYIRNGIL